MLSFGEHINLILKDRSNWDYYKNTQFYGSNYKELFTDCRYFIESILSNGQKLTGLARKQFDKLEDGYRLEHTVSLYFLGIIIYENVSWIRSSINRYIESIGRSGKRFNTHTNNFELDFSFYTPFSYFWFLICFYHDYGYSFEERNRSEAFEDLLNELEGELNLILPRNFVRTGVPKEITNNIGKYIGYRYKVDKKLDHGIVAGLLYWKERRKDYFERGKKYNRNEFVDNNRLWSKEILYNIHLPVAWTIAAHNVWFGNENSDYYDKYYEYGLDELITKRPKISLKRHPFLFLLSIVDTIDPVKLLMQSKHHIFTVDDLESIMFNFDGNTINYVINYDDEIVNSRYKESIKDIKSWICCDSKHEEKIFSIICS